MNMTWIRRLSLLGAIVLAAGVVAGCGGGGGGSSSDSSGGDSGGGNQDGGDPAPLAWHLGLSPSTAVDGALVRPTSILVHTPDTDDTKGFVSIAAAPARVDAFHRVDDDTYYVSLSQQAEVDGLTVAAGDVVLSDNGSLSIAFDASSAGLPDGVNVDAVALSPEDDFILSTDIHFALGGERFEDADLIRYDGNVFTLYRSADELGLDAAADINAVSLRENGELALSLRTGGGSAGGLVYAATDVLVATETEGISRVALAVGTELATPAGVNAVSDNQ